MEGPKRIVKCVSFAAAGSGLAIMMALLIASYRFAGDFSGRYESVEFRRHFWTIFFVGAFLSVLGCLIAAAVIRIRAAIHAGLWAMGFSVAMLFFTVMGMFNVHDWPGGVAMSLFPATFFAGAVLSLVVGLRLAWMKLHS